MIFNSDAQIGLDNPIALGGLVTCPMAFHKHFKLPPFKLTQRSAAGVQVQDVHRGASSQQSPSDERGSLAQDNPASNQCQSSLLEPSAFSQGNPVPLDEPTHHELQSKASVRGWEKLRNGMLSAATESSAMPIGQLCLLCPEPAIFRCQECGPLMHYCSDCFRKQHEKANFYHVAEKWEVRYATESKSIVCIDIANNDYT